MKFDTNDPPPGTCGIYAIYSACNDKIYIGYSDDIKRRWRNHKSVLNRGDKKECNPHLLNAWRKYGPDAFEFYVIEECTVELLHIREQFHLDRYPRHYNFGECAESPRRGVPHTDESKAKMSAVLTGFKRSPESRERIATAKRGTKASNEARANMSVAKIGNTNRLGTVHSPETKARMSESRMGHAVSDETRAGMSERMMGNTYSLGRQHTEESKAKMSEAKTGLKASDESRAINSASHTGLKATDEARANMSKAQTGRKHTEEAKAKISAAKKLYWEQKRAEGDNNG